MVEQTRRRFVKQTSIGVGAAMVGAAVLPSLAALRLQLNAPSNTPLHMSRAGAPLPESIVVHVRDVATAEIAVLVGTQEIVYRDPEMMARLLQAAGRAVRTEG